MCQQAKFRQNPPRTFGVILHSWTGRQQHTHIQKT